MALDPLDANAQRRQRASKHLSNRQETRTHLGATLTQHRGNLAPIRAQQRREHTQHMHDQLRLAAAMYVLLQRHLRRVYRHGQRRRAARGGRAP